MTALQPLHAVAQEAKKAVRAGQRRQAVVRLGEALQLHDPVTAAADPDLIDAAVTYAALADGSPDAQLSWADYAYRASSGAYGRHHDVTTDAAEVLTSVLVNQGLSVNAIPMLAELSDAYTQRNDFPGTCRTRILRAELLHADGRCDEAHQQVTTAYKCWHHRRSDPALHLHGVQITLRQATILAGCGRHHVALRLLQPRQQPLSRTDQLTCSHIADQIKDLAIADDEHAPICTRPSSTTAPVRVAHRAYQNLLNAIRAGNEALPAPTCRSGQDRQEPPD